MSRFAFRNLLCVSPFGAEKIAIACAALGLIQGTVHASETPASAASIDDPWINPAAPQKSAALDAWGSAKALTASIDDPWSSASRHGTVLEASNPVPVAAAQVVTAPTRLVMDTDGWNDKPRGRAPGLIASNNAWRTRPNTVAVAAEQPAPVAVPPVEVAVPVEQPVVKRPTISNLAWASPSDAERAAPFDVSSHWNFSRTLYAWTPRISGGMRYNGAGMPLEADAQPVSTASTSMKLSGSMATVAETSR